MSELNFLTFFFCDSLFGLNFNKSKEWGSLYKDYLGRTDLDPDLSSFLYWLNLSFNKCPNTLKN